MQVVNSNGSVIEERLLTDAQKYLATLHWPENAKTIADLSWADFKTWLYSIEPRDAMILSSDKNFQGFFNGYLTRNKWRFIWRLMWE